MEARRAHTVLLVRVDYMADFLLVELGLDFRCGDCLPGLLWLL
jgi:hypothetical protein